MKIENLFEQISSLDSFDEKSGILANAVISSLASPINDAALMCGLIYWFNEGVIRRFTNDDSVAKEAIDTIMNLPFVEAKGNGFAFHESVRSGLRSSYEKEPDLTIKAYSTALPVLLNNMEDDIAAITATYGLIATNDSRADDTISSIIERFSRSHQLNKLKVFAQDMQEVLGLAKDNTLSDKRWIQIGWLQLSNIKLDDAISSCERALRVNPSNEDAYLLRATVSEIKGDFDTALTLLNETVSKFSKSVKAYLSRASLHILREDYSHASSDYYKVLDIDPKLSFAYMGLARIFKQKGNKTKELSLYKQAITLDPENIWIYMERGSILSSDGQYEEALTDFNKVLEINPSIDLALIGRATVYKREEKYDLALADLQNALIINPANVIAIHMMADIYYNLGKYHNALKSLQEVLSINPEFALAYESLWKTCLKIGDIEQARRYLLKALDLSSQDSSYYFALFRIAVKYKEFELGILASRKGLEVNSNEVIFYGSLAYCYVQTGELDLAEININKTMDLKDFGSVEEEALVALGIIKWLKGNKSVAQQMFQKAVNVITKKQKQANYFDGSKKNVSKRRALRNVVKLKFYILGWVDIVMGRVEIGISEIKKFIKDNPDEVDCFTDLRDWTNAMLKSPDAPVGLKDLQDLINNIFLE